ncbi:ABC transporter ATP-binding protein [Paenibacillus aceris]|uniref:Iron(III) transport system ATP-binding protein n=1 Tax=Paenibacillus aceris TaxID=869555 RepID=A0ABS4HVE3_9BACL|nr:ABC transporter ATP-binding protein [Paenibacillus aceris]MBP1962612.1 iron(III) transport system ATP-binding protein [Paenibacillus aceris]NHW37421.1 ABC transporter ATP-binding protein [Paenibacillus aceris]
MTLQLRGINKSFGASPALKDIQLTLTKGKFTTLLGPSGCGKTTLLRIIAGLESPDEGEIHLGDVCLFSKQRRVNRPVHQRDFGMVFQDFALWPHLTVLENVAFGLKAKGDTANWRQRAMEAIDLVQLLGMEKRYPHQLSGGQQQRVALARAIVVRPQLVLFDEPMSALDALLREEMRIELMNLVRNIGFTAIYVTHDQTEAMSMSDEIVVMQSGVILQKDVPEVIYRRPAHPFTARFIGKTNWLEADKRLIRPEHIRWERLTDQDLVYSGVVRSVSYMGERYEINVGIGDHDVWMAYHPSRLSIGENVKLYISQEQIHEL